ncbi:MAG: hypothetical protein HY819_00595 [Acidobacteria bacterium]|nr:hypothetical protein [Acidobacteriota bacterium]
MENKLINGWSREEIELLCERTGCAKELVIKFCQAVDKYLYLMLPTESKRATLHFHLRDGLKEDDSNK